MSPTASLILVNWNGAQHVPICFNALRQQTVRDFEIILVDNHSHDNSLELLARDFPEVKVIALQENLGFAGGSNVGIRAAQGDFIILLNNDTEVDAYWLEEVLAAFERHPEAGSVASKMKLFDQRDKFHTTGDFYRIDGLPGNRGVWEVDQRQYDREEYVFSACGGSAAYRRSMLDQIGLLDEDFFFSCEDVDLGWRAQLAGWQCVYAPRAVIYHKLKATGGGATASFYDGRNFLWLIAKNYPASLWKINRGKIVRKQWSLFIEAARAWRGQAARARIRGILAGLIGLPKMLRKRRAVHALRRVDDAYLQSILQGD
ncbi:N-acetylglucosaminyl-diphospho-decaprenol L-rhamnosyltransferase [Gammaproteobacteria bacterium]|nr:N-acetylglucosaminyl-diphospho-decaprenol L-rhamnosyltransferase [Gammaproteobacteria bacterium]